MSTEPLPPRTLSAPEMVPSTISTPSPIDLFPRESCELWRPTMSCASDVHDLPISFSPTETDPLPFVTHLINEVSKTGLWQAYINHPFVIELGKGTLDRRRFEHYIKSVWCSIMV